MYKVVLTRKLLQAGYDEASARNYIGAHLLNDDYYNTSLLPITLENVIQKGKTIDDMKSYIDREIEANNDFKLFFESDEAEDTGADIVDDYAKIASWISRKNVRGKLTNMIAKMPTALRTLKRGERRDLHKDTIVNFVRDNSIKWGKGVSGDEFASSIATKYDEMHGFKKH